MRQQKTIRLGRIQVIREIMVLRSTYHKPIFSAREWDGDRSVELSCVAPQSNRRITGSGTNGSSTRHTTARCERTIVATSTPRWGHPKLRSTVFRSDPQNQSYLMKTGAGICYCRNRKHLQCVPNVLPPVPNNEPDDTDIQAEDPGEILPPDDPGDAVELPVDVPAGLNN